MRSEEVANRRYSPCLLAYHKAGIRDMQTKASTTTILRMDRYPTSIESKIRTAVVVTFGISEDNINLSMKSCEVSRARISGIIKLELAMVVPAPVRPYAHLHHTIIAVLGDLLQAPNELRPRQCFPDMESLVSRECSLRPQAISIVLRIGAVDLYLSKMIGISWTHWHDLMLPIRQIHVPRGIARSHAARRPFLLSPDADYRTARITLEVEEIDRVMVACRKAMLISTRQNAWCHELWHAPICGSYTQTILLLL
nr:hypothetical protein CFP56_07580 [Quercus suber]